MVLRNILADCVSEVRGICTYASPANTISATLSFLRTSINLVRICFARANRFGETSSANIELETSIAIASSIPSFSTSSTLVPNCGRASKKMPTHSAPKISQNFK